MYILKFIFIFNYIVSIKIKLLKTSIHNYLPLKLHYIALIQDNNTSYTFDFTPYNQSNKNIMKLLLNQNVNGNIRLRSFNDIEYKDIESKFHNINKINEYECKKLSIETLNKITNKNLYNLFKYYLDLKIEMNLYSNNCQHFYNKIENDFYKKTDKM